MDEVIQIIEKSPFVKSSDAKDGFLWSLEVKDPSTNRTVDFKSTVDEFLAAKPRFKAIWDEVSEASL